MRSPRRCQSVPLGRWEKIIRCAVRSTAISRVRVSSQIGSTQDEARKLVKLNYSSPFIVVARRQIAGRGREGRAWSEAGGGGMAMTLGIPAPEFLSEKGDGGGLLSLAAGVAAVNAIRRLAAHGGANLKQNYRSEGRFIGLKWPNDIVHGRRDVTVEGSLRKLGGVLVERVGGWFLVGVGLNVYQPTSAWPAVGLRSTAVSLRELGIVGRVPLLAGLVGDEMFRLLASPQAEVVEQWGGHDLLTGRRSGFVSGGMETRGVVQAIEPLKWLDVKQEHDGEVIRLNAATTVRLRD